MDYKPYIDRLKREKEKECRLREERRFRALHAAKRMSSLLKKDFGAEKVYLFGSSLEEGYFYFHSDIDLGVQGISPRIFLKAYYEVNALDHGFKVDLIDLKTCDDFLKRRILKGDVTLAEEIENDIEKLKKRQFKIYKGIAKLRESSEDHHIYLDSVVLHLHSFYTELENIFKKIASRMDGEVPLGENWRSDLLNQMTTSLNDVRPNVISKKILPELRDLLAFRHRIRNIYSFQIDEENVIRMCHALNSYGKELFAELKAFVVFLKKTGENS